MSIDENDAAKSKSKKEAADLADIPLYLHKRLKAEYDSTEHPSASPERAAEIANMNNFGQLEFWELTGVRRGKYGRYDIADDGITLRLAKSSFDRPEEQRILIQKITARALLKFPCTPQELYDWYENSIDANGISDFPLATGFLKALGKSPIAKEIDGVSPVTSHRIIEAFPVKENSVENQLWWDERMRSAKKYSGLLDARAATGGKGRGKPSLWHPLRVADWLIDNGHLKPEHVIRAVKTNFPGCNTVYLGGDD